MILKRKITDIIEERYSCRKYCEGLTEKDEDLLKEYIRSLTKCPMGGIGRFEIIKNSKAPDSHKKLGTYGFISGKFDYIAGVIGDSKRNFEDFGYMMEMIVLYSVGLGLGTCWLGGTFAKSRFAEILALTEDEHIPAVISIGRAAGHNRSRSGIISLLSGAKKRMDRGKLFFHNDFKTPLDENSAKDYSICLEMVRLAPSGSNQQPWRIVLIGDKFHFYLKRTKGYRENIFYKLMDCSDIQRIDMGIAMAHFELTAEEIGLKGKWCISEPDIATPGPLYEYCITWEK